MFEIQPTNIQTINRLIYLSEAIPVKKDIENGSLSTYNKR